MRVLDALLSQGDELKDTVGQEQLARQARNLAEEAREYDRTILAQWNNQLPEGCF